MIAFRMAESLSERITISLTASAFAGFDVFLYLGF